MSDSKEAEYLLTNPRFKQAFANVRENIVNQLEHVDIGNEAGRLELVVSLQVLRAIKQDIKNDIQNVQMTNIQNII